MGEYDRQFSRDFLYQRQICRSRPSGQRRCVRRVRFVFAYEGPTDGTTALGMEFALASDLHPTRTNFVAESY